MSNPLEASLPLVESEDYYLEDGLFVFTAAYHLKRGHCCHNDCRHCPYGDAGLAEQRPDDNDDLSSDKLN
jgi:hypothetical protein